MRKKNKRGGKVFFFFFFLSDLFSSSMTRVVSVFATEVVSLVRRVLDDEVFSSERATLWTVLEQVSLFALLVHTAVLSVVREARQVLRTTDSTDTDATATEERCAFLSESESEREKNHRHVTKPNPSAATLAHAVELDMKPKTEEDPFGVFFFSNCHGCYNTYKLQLHKGDVVFQFRCICILFVHVLF